MARLRINFIGGQITDNPLTSGATTMNSDAFAALPTIASPDYAAITIDPDGIEGNPEIAWITAHTLGATSATVSRGQEGTTALQHSQDIFWAHGPTLQDFDGASGGSGLIGLSTYDPGSLAAPNTTNLTLTVIDATNLKVTFTAPSSGKVLHRASLGIHNGGSVDGSIFLGLADATSTAITASAERVQFKVNVVGRAPYSWLETGLTPGTSYERRMAFKVGSGSGERADAVYGGGYGAAVMEVWAVNL